MCPSSGNARTGHTGEPADPADRTSAVRSSGHRRSHQPHVGTPVRWVLSRGNRARSHFGHFGPIPCPQNEAASICPLRRFHAPLQSTCWAPRSTRAARRSRPGGPHTAEHARSAVSRPPTQYGETRTDGTEPTARLLRTGGPINTMQQHRGRSVRVGDRGGLGADDFDGGLGWIP